VIGHRCLCSAPEFKVHGQPGRLVLDGCDHPMLLVCGRCSGELIVRCNATREDRCEPCGKRHNRRLKRLIGSGFVDRPTGFFFATGTAPGADVLPWDTSTCNHGDRRCSGKMGCRVERLTAARWNGFAPQVWSWMMTEIRRRLPGHDVQFWKCWETQQRGVLHVHAIIWCVGVSAARMADIWKKVLQKKYQMDDGYRFEWGTERSCDAIGGSGSSVAELIDLHGFSFEEATEVREGEQQAEQLKFIRYGAKYCTKGGKRACTVNRVTGEIRDDGRGYRTWSASSRWGLRMKQIRADQQVWAQQAATAAGVVAGTADEVGGTDSGTVGGALDSSSDFYAGPFVVCSVGSSDQLL